MSIHLKTIENSTSKDVVGPSGNSYVKSLKDFFEEVARVAIFSLRFFKEALKTPYEFNEIAKQSYLIGYKSFPLIAITGFIIGLVFTIQSRPTLAEFGAESWLPAMVSVSIVRELGPMITALIFAGKVGSGIGAELASMKVTEQIDAMEVSGINPFKYLVVTRVIAATFMLPVLVIIADGISIYGAFVGVNLEGDVSFHLFFSQAIGKLVFADIYPSIIKTIFFGFSIGIIGCYKGYNATKGTEGVGQASNAAVVLASLSVFILDMIAVQITSLFI